MILTTHVWKYVAEGVKLEERLIISFGKERAYIGRNWEDLPPEGWFTLNLECHATEVIPGEELL